MPSATFQPSVTYLSFKQYYMPSRWARGCAYNYEHGRICWLKIQTAGGQPADRAEEQAPRGALAVPLHRLRPQDVAIPLAEQLHAPTPLGCSGREGRAEVGLGQALAHTGCQATADNTHAVPAVRCAGAGKSAPAHAPSWMLPLLEMPTPLKKLMSSRREGCDHTACGGSPPACSSNCCSCCRDRCCCCCCCDAPLCDASRMAAAAA